MQAREQKRREASARIIAEEKAKTERMRSQKRASSYQARAEAFFGATKRDCAKVGHADVPWPGKTFAEVKAAVLGGLTDPSQARKQVKQELKRWHPDRWGATMLGRVVAADRDAVVASVHTTSQLITAILADFA